MKRRLKVPPALNQFNRTLDRNAAQQFLKLCTKIRPETRAQKRARLKSEAERIQNGEDVKKSTPKPVVVKYGINHVTALIEAKKPKLVAIAHDVDPIELVVFLPALCRKMGIPYVIIKGKSRLGQIVHKKTATALAITEVHPSMEQDLKALISIANSQFNDKADEIRRTWGGGIMSIESQQRLQKIQEAQAKNKLK